MDWFEKRLLITGDDDQYQIRGRLAVRAILQGRLTTADTLLGSLQGPDGGAFLAIRAWMHMLRGQPTDAVREYESALVLLRKAYGRKNTTFHSDFSLFYVPALLACHKHAEAERAVEVVCKDQSQPLQETYKMFRSVIRLHRGELAEASALSVYVPARGVVGLLGAAAHVWNDPDRALTLVPALEGCYETEQKAGNRWLAAEYAELLARATGLNNWKELADESHAACTTVTVMNLIASVQAWERKVTALETLARKNPPATAVVDSRTQRIVWLVGFYGKPGGDLIVSLQPRQQKRPAGKSGSPLGGGLDGWSCRVS